MLFLAMSAFQGQTQDDAFTALMRHRPAGIQLTPGNLPSEGFRARVAAADVVTRPHHGFSWSAYRQAVYDDGGRPLLKERCRSLHPPRSQPPVSRRGRVVAPTLVVEPNAWLESAAADDLLLETMMPGYVLGNGAELERAMAMGLRLAVDVSHLEIQRWCGALNDGVYRRVLGYARIEEVHVSTSRRCYDTHGLLTPDTPGLAWARERLPEVPVVLESHWHRLDVEQQREQLQLLGVRTTG